MVILLLRISPVPAALRQRYLARFMFSVLDGYGQTVNIGISDMTLSSTEAQEIPSTSIGASIKILAEPIPHSDAHGYSCSNCDSG
jgi:hypothetical protein